MDKTRASVESILDKKNSINSQDSIDEGPNNTKKVNILSDISRKDFFDFMRTAYQVYESVEGNIDMPSRPKVDWDELEKNPVIKMLMDNIPNCSDDLVLRRGSEGGTATDSIEGPSNRFLSSDTENKDQSNLSKGKKAELRRNSLSIINRKTFNHKRDPKTDPEEGYIDSVLKSKLSDILNEGILDSVLPYMVGNVKPVKPVNSCHQPIIKKNVSSGSGNESKKSTTFSGIANDQDGKEKPSVSSRIGRRKSSTGGEKFLTKGDGEVEIHVCDEVKGLKKDFKCPQKLLVSKMGYFADVTSGQKLEDMDISVHCDIQIFDWLMRWVKKDSILAADWPQLDPTNVVPILVSASFLQMDPLLHDCLMYCHSNMSDIVKTNTNLACLNDTILTRLGAMYTNSELEAIKDRKDKIQSRLFCKMIMSLGEPVSETIRGHYASLATLYKCCKCNKLLPRQIADRVPCTPSSMSIDRWGNIISSHTRDLNWNLSEYITSLHGELKSWRRVYWRLWGECHFLKCTTCDNYFPVHQMEWCCYHADMPQFFSLDPTRATCLPVGRYPCCGERAYRFQVLNNSTQGCQFREHCSEQKLDHDVAILTIYNEFKDIIMLEPPRLMFPERLTRLVARENGDETGRLAGKEIFWWEGLKLAPQRQPLGLLGKLYSGSTVSKLPINSKQVETSPLAATTRTMSMIQLNSSTNTNSAVVSNSIPNVPNETNTETDINTENKNITTINQSNISNNGKEKKNTTNPKEASSSDSGEAEESESSTGESSHSEESSPPRSPAHRRGPIRRRPRFLARRRAGMGGRQWAVALSARSNQDQQRQYEERAARQMRVLLARRAAAPQSKPMQPLGGVYVRLEAEWREVNLPPPAVPPQRPVRHLYSAKGMRSKQTK